VWRRAMESFEASVIAYQQRVEVRARIGERRGGETRQQCVCMRTTMNREPQEAASIALHFLFQVDYPADII
jgi:hypothetical protein